MLNHINEKIRTSFLVWTKFADSTFKELFSTLIEAKI